MRKQPTETPPLDLLSLRRVTVNLWSEAAVDWLTLHMSPWIQDRHMSLLVLFRRSHTSRQALTKREDFPEQNAKRPDVTQRGIEVVEDALWCHPLHRQEGLWGKERGN